MITHEDLSGEYLNSLDRNSSLIQNLYDRINDLGHVGSGKGGYFNRYQLNMSRTDRFGQNPLPPNNENVGLTFITRPKLNLSTTSIRQNEILATLDTLDNTTMPFAIRCMLDTNFSNNGVAKNISKLCPWFDSDVPYMNILSNNLLQINGWPDFSLQTAASEDGFFSENQTIARGSDFLNQTYDLSLNFRDIDGGPVIALFYYWVMWIALLCRGDVTRYTEDTLTRRISYSCSIYRFTLDPSKQYIRSWSKATGCFPKDVPFGEKFNITDRTHFITALQDFSIPFVANHIEYMNPRSLKDFNKIMDVFGGPMFKPGGKELRDDRIPMNNIAENNFKGIPYIDLAGGKNTLLWLGDQNEVANTAEQSMIELKNKIDAEVKRFQNSSSSTDNISVPKSNSTLSNPYGNVDDLINLA